MDSMACDLGMVNLPSGSVIGAGHNAASAVCWRVPPRAVERVLEGVAVPAVPASFVQIKPGTAFLVGRLKPSQGRKPYRFELG
ncbi:hypothetical protein GCM10020219_017300 [Nonomuraea dietziae]